MSGRDSKTVVVLADDQKQMTPGLLVEFPDSHGKVASQQFLRRFVVGRDLGCDISIQDDGISRKHFEVFIDGGSWWVRDLGSSNGTYLNGTRIDRAQVDGEATVEFYARGPVVHLSVLSSPAARPTPQHARDSRNPVDPGSVPEPPRHDASHSDKSARKHRTRFRLGMSIMTALLAGALTVIFVQHQDRSETLALAEQLFYDTKSLELELARLKTEFTRQPGAPIPPPVRKSVQRLKEMQTRYDNLAKEMELIGSHRSKEDLLIFRVSRLFGEYDLSIPDSFVSEVKRYIHKWQQSERLQKAIVRMNEDNRAAVVVRALRERDLPPQFIYLAVQESNFKTDAIGPRTRFGIAKGMWQFIPQTATRYGLKTGPDKEKRRYDPRDERFDFRKSTEAAADYLRFLYTTEAQASGLLVMSAYNWGEGNIGRVVNRLPDNPAERNFWRLLDTQMIPDETYGYVLNIVAAAVIGEDPQHFGFSFKNPLQDR